jgi:zinc transport system ATP-binding protein
MNEITPPPIIELEEVTVRFQNFIALENVTLQVRRGDFLAVIGPNGSGKTTLLRAILGLVQPTHGSVRLFGKAPCDFSEWSRIGYVPQIARIDPRFPIRVFDVVLMGRYGQVGLIRRPSRRDREAAKTALDRVGLIDLADRQIGRLSGGQRQRVLVARALAAEPELLILDEPTSGVDVTTTESMFELLGRFHRQGMTVIVVSHDVGVVAQHVSTVACLNRTLVAHGRPKEVLRPDILECMYGREAALVGHGQTPHLVVRVHPDEEA